jgi:hypothetical protein
MRRAVVSFFLLLAAALPAAAAADWHQPVGGASPINQSATHNAGDLDLASIAGVPHIVWNEDTTEGNAGSSSTIRVARLSADGTSWEKVANGGTHPISQLSSTSSATPSITPVGSVPWVAWSEGLSATDAEIRVARLNSAGNGWERIPDTTRPINHLRTAPGGDAMNPTLRDAGGRPYVGFFEHDPGSGSLFFGSNRDPAKVWVMRLNAAGNGWDEVGGGPANPDSTHDAAFPKMTMINGKPWLVFFQVVTGPAITIRVAHLSDDGNSWVQVPAPVPSGDPNAPEIENIGGVPYVALADGSPKRIKVYRLNAAGDGWDQVGSGPASPAGGDADAPSLEEVSGEPWVSWRQDSAGTTIRSARLVNGEWETVGSPYANASSNASIRNGPALASINGFPWVAFGESDGSSPGGQNVQSCCTQERVARLEPDFLGTNAYPADTSATLLTGLRNYGLPFPVGFEYGTDTSFGSQSNTKNADQSVNEDSVFTSVTGLSPTTFYRYRPFATAGTPLPRVRGTASAFVTTQPQSHGSVTGRLLVALLRFPQRVRSGRKVAIRYFTTDDGKAELRVYKRVRGRWLRVDRVKQTAHAGRNRLVWDGHYKGRRAGPGLFRLKLTVERSDGTVSRDADNLRVLPR